MFYELRQYQIEPGHMKKFVQVMEKYIIPFQVKQGMTIVGMWTGNPQQYKVQDGDALPQIAERFRTTVAAIQKRNTLSGTTVRAGDELTIPSDETDFVWIRRFESEAQRQRLYKKVYQSKYWKEQVTPRIAGMLVPRGANVRQIVPTRHSVLR